MEDYSNFSWESIQKSWRDLVSEVQRETGATDEQMTFAIGFCARKFMDTNFMEEPNARD
jgi:hypothetical protein